MTVIRPRRLRVNAAMRGLVRETHVNLDGLIAPLFVCEGSGVRTDISSMPGVQRTSVDNTVDDVRALAGAGVRGVLLFGIPNHKDALASANYDPNGLVQRAIREIKRGVPDMLVAADLCNCEYTDHGHCGIVDSEGNVDNDATLALLAKTALTYAQAGVDVIAPSDMMDGRVGHLRRTLDEAGHTPIAIMSYAVKYASAFYGPFREAAGCTPAFGDRKTYQMDPANAREAVREAELDVAEGADILMVKPALAYLDVVRELRERFTLPLAVYNVSGEYAMIKAAAAAGSIDEAAVVDEMFASFARAGAGIIISYFSKSYVQRHG